MNPENGEKRKKKVELIRIYTCLRQRGKSLFNLKRSPLFCATLGTLNRCCSKAETRMKGPLNTFMMIVHPKITILHLETSPKNRKTAL